MAGRPTRRAGLPTALLLLLLPLGACGTTPPFAGDPDPGPYDRLNRRELESLAAAREDLIAGRLAAAEEAAARLHRVRPRNVVVGALLQDAQLARLAAEDTSLPEGADPARALARRWRAEAEADPTSARLVLAARLEEDRPAARRLLREALELDPDCVWAHYGLAHLDALEGEWTAAGVHLDDALAIDPGHLASLRLRAAALVRSGDSRRAVDALEEWIERALEDPRAEPRAIDAARLDLAILSIDRGDRRKAREALAAIEDPGFERARRLAAQAALEEADGRPGRALAAAREAEEIAPGEPVPLVQQALLFDTWLGDPVGALAAWDRLRAGAHENADLGSWLYYLRAQIEIERLTERGLDPDEAGLRDLAREPR